MARIPFDNTYVTLPPRFYSRLDPQPVAAPQMVRVNTSLLTYLGIEPGLLAGEEGAKIVGGLRVPQGAEPIATVYAGHQFGSFNPQLGDGRAILLGEVVARDGRRHDLQLKGSGRTPYSRGGDGRSPLGPALREYVVSEAMAALGIPTTRSLAVATTGERVHRNQLVPGGILLRVAQSHIRVGTFEYFASRGDTEGLALLVAHALRRHFPEYDEREPAALALLRGVAERQAQLIARWQLVGFIHGVMNTDNMLVSGETIDYGPCAFMDAFNPAQVFSSIDQIGRYAYRNQPRIARWNLVCLARALVGLLEAEGGTDAAQQVVDGFADQHAAAHARGMAAKLGLTTEEPDDAALVQGLFDAMHAGQADFTLTFRHLADLADPEGSAADPDRTVAALFEPPEPLRAWIVRFQARLEREPSASAERAASMRATNPALIPRNHLIEAAIRDAEDRGDFGRFHALVDALSTPFTYAASRAPYATPPLAEERVARTFCGT